MAMKIRKYGDVLDGAPEMHVDLHYHNPAFNAISQTFPLSMVESTYTNYQPATLDSIAISVFVNIG